MPVTLTSGNAATQEFLSSLEWRAAGKQHGVSILVASDTIQDVHFEKRLSADSTAHTVSCTIMVRGPAAAEFLASHPLAIAIGAHDPDLRSVEPSDAGGTVELAAITSKKVHRINAAKAGRDFVHSDALWAGIKNRFSACMVRSQKGDTVQAILRQACPELVEVAQGERNSTLEKMGYSLEIHCSSAQSHAFTVYAGPVKYELLRSCDPQLTRIMFAMLWNWMRWLSFGLLFLLDWLMEIIPSAGLAVMALSVCVKVLMFPLIFIAERWQKQVNETKSRLQPMLDEIARNYRGEEKNRRTLEAYKQMEVSPLYTLKSLLSALIQIPIFFAAYHMLSENVALSGNAFLWIKDLAVPDRLFALPFSLPLFGSFFNLLPFCMTAISLCASWLFSDKSLSPELRRRQRRNLYIMAAAFFLLFYPVPSGMVLYWTMNNVLSLIKAVYARYQQMR